MRAEILLEIEESHLHIHGRLEEVAELLVEHEHTTIVGVLEPIVFHVLIDGTSDRTTRDQLPIGETQEITEFIGNLLLTPEPIVLRAVGGLLTSGVFLGSLNLTDNLGKSLDVVADGGDFGENRFGRHYTFYKTTIFKYVSIAAVMKKNAINHVNTRILYIFPNP
jgi:hypothetical protein